MSRMSHIMIPTICDTSQDFNRLFEMVARIKRASDSQKRVVLVFNNCEFLMQNAVAVLGGLTVQIRERGGNVDWDFSTLSPNIRMNLKQNGLITALSGSGTGWQGNSIPFTNHRTKDQDAIVEYLMEYWLGRGWVNASQLLINMVVRHVWEIYENAFMHSGSRIGVFSCGQHYPKRGLLKLSVVDLGIGISSRVHNYYQSEHDSVGVPFRSLTHAYYLEQAFRRNFSTRKGEAAGLGLNLLKSFIRVNRGTLQVFSNAASVRFDKVGEKYNRQTPSFQGTVFNISLICDEKRYILKGERST